MAYMATPSVVLQFGDRTAEVPAAGGLADLRAAAEAEFDLQPDSYGFFDACGKVEGPALQRAFRLAAGGPCALEVRERPEWQRLRRLEARIEAVAAQQASGARAPPSGGPPAEQLVAEKVEAALRELSGELKRVEAKVDSSFAPFLKDLSAAQLDVQAKLDSFDAAAIAARLDDVEAQIAAGRAPDLPKGIPACALDLAPEPRSDVLCRRPDVAEGRVPGSGTSARPWAGARSVADAQPAETLPRLTKAWLRNSKLAELEWGEQLGAGPFVRCAAARRLDGAAAGSRSTPVLPRVL